MTPWPPTPLLSLPICWPLARAARALARAPEFPPVDRWSELARAGGLPDPGVRFEVQPPRARRRRRARGHVGYDESIVERGVVPSRERSWHDLLNFLVWHTFPRAKAAVHARQLAAQCHERSGPDLGHARSRERDALALLDEGGVIVGTLGSVRRFAPFGHALYEQLLLAPRPTTALYLDATLPGPPDGVPSDDAFWLAHLDDALATELRRAGSFLEPRDYPRLELRDDGAAFRSLA